MKSHADRQRTKNAQCWAMDVIEFNNSAVKNGILVDPEHLAFRRPRRLFEKNIIGHIKH
jgi:hypothetical protein